MSAPSTGCSIVASRQPELCGLRVDTHHLTWTGGYSFFHRNAPLYSMAGPVRSSGFYNFIIASTAETAGNPAPSDGGFVLRRLGPFGMNTRPQTSTAGRPATTTFARGWAR